MSGPSVFDPGQHQFPDALSASELPAQGKGRVVAFLASRGSQDSGWGADAVVEIAKRWAADGMRVFLADLDLDRPELHDRLGFENGEGVTDAFAFGASVQRVAQRVGDSPFFFASAGTPTGDPASILGHPRWNTIAQGFEEAGAALLLYVPESTRGAADILDKATDVVMLGTSSQAAEASVDPALDPRMFAWLSEPGAEPPAAAESIEDDAAAAAIQVGATVLDDDAPGDQALPDVQDDAEATLAEMDAVVGEVAPAAADELEASQDVDPGQDIEAAQEDEAVLNAGISDELVQSEEAEFADVDWAVDEESVPEMHAVDLDAAHGLAGDPGEFDDVEAAQDPAAYHEIDLDAPDAALEAADSPSADVLGTPEPMDGDSPESFDELDTHVAADDITSQDAEPIGDGSTDDGPFQPDGMDVIDAAEEYGSEDWSAAVDEAASLAALGVDRHTDEEPPAPDLFLAPPRTQTQKQKRRRPPRLMVLGGVLLVLVVLVALDRGWIPVGGDDPDVQQAAPVPAAPADAPTEDAEVAEGQDPEATPPTEGVAAAGDQVADDTPTQDPQEDQADAGSEAVPVPDDVTAPADTPPDPASIAAPVMTYSLVLRSDPARSSADDLAARLSAGIGDLLFVVSPSIVNGATWYRILAGPAADVSRVEEIRASVAATGMLSGSGDWFVRRTNLSFLLGDLPTVGAADGLAQALAQEGIPAYVLEVAYSDGPSRFRVYAGGYASEAEAAALAELIRATDRTPELTERVGILPGG